MARDKPPRRISAGGPTPLKRPEPLSRVARLGPGEPYAGKMQRARILTREEGESLEDFVIRQKKEYLVAANEQRRRLKVLRRALRLRAIDDSDLVKGNIPEFEELIATWSIERLLRACPRIGPVRSHEILEAAQVSPRAEVRKLSYAKRAELARMLDEVRSAYGSA